MVYGLRRNRKIVTLLSLISGLILALVLLALPGLPWSTHSRRFINRQFAGIQKRVARYQGIEAKLMSIKGRIKIPGGLIQSSDPNYKWAALADAEGRFLLPELNWFPGTIHKLAVSSDDGHNYQVEIYAPWNFPQGGTLEAGELNSETIDANLAGRVSGVGSIEYDDSNDEFYRELYRKITEGKKSDGEKIMALNHYVAMKRIRKKKPPSRTVSPVQLLSSESPYSFLCGAMSRALAHLAIAGGYEARLIDMIKLREGKRAVTHVVIEIFYDDSWHLYDPTYGISYKKNDGDVASHKDIRIQSDILSQHLASIREGEKMPRWLAEVYSTGVHRVYSYRRLEQ